MFGPQQHSTASALQHLQVDVHQGVRKPKVNGCGGAVIVLLPDPCHRHFFAVEMMSSDTDQLVGRRKKPARAKNVFSSWGFILVATDS